MTLSVRRCLFEPWKSVDPLAFPQCPSDLDSRRRWYNRWTPVGFKPSSNFLSNSRRPGPDTQEMLQPGASILCCFFPPWPYFRLILTRAWCTSLPGTRQQSGVDGEHPARSAVRCDKLMANLTRRRCRADRGWQLFDGRLALAAARVNVAWKLVSGIGRDDVYELRFPLKRWSVDGGGAEIGCRRSPADLSQQGGSAVNDCSQGRLPHRNMHHVTWSQKGKFSIFLGELGFEWKSVLRGMFSIWTHQIIWLWPRVWIIGIVLWPPFIQTRETESAVVTGSLSLKSRPGARLLPPSLRRLNVFVWLLLKACTDLKTTAKIINNPPSPPLIQRRHDGKVAPFFHTSNQSLLKDQRCLWTLMQISKD